MDQSFHYLIMVSQALFQKKILNRLMKVGLTSGQPKVLDFLGRHNGSIQKDIAFACQIDPATLSGILERMEEKGLVERRISNGNRRSSHVYLTESGKENSRIVKEVFREIEEEVFHGIDEKEKEQLLSILYKLCCNMTDIKELQ